MGLSKRLMALAELVNRGDKVADIGTDHAYLPIYLIEQKICGHLIAGELNLGPYAAAVKNIKEAGLEDLIDIRHGNGLAIVAPGEVDTVMISGMGGVTMAEILESQPEVTESLQKLLLQPMADEKILRKWLMENNWLIVEEKLVLEDNKLYTIIKAQPGKGEQLTREQLAFGPRLLEKKDPLLKTKLEDELQHKKRIIEQIQKSKTPNIEARALEIQLEIDTLERVLQWLSSVEQS